MTDFTPETPVLTPIHDHAAELAKAEAGVAEMAANRNNRWYPKYHIASNGGWINDPNGLCFYKGRWHVFYQLHPYGTQWGPMHWGHVSSTDMLNWKREPIMFAPSLEQEKDGVFSGSAVIDDNGDLRFYYTGHRWANGHDNTGGDWQVQMTALPDNDELTSATKQGMIIDCRPTRSTTTTATRGLEDRRHLVHDLRCLLCGQARPDVAVLLQGHGPLGIRARALPAPGSGCVHARMPRLLPHQRQGRQREVGHWLLRHGVQAQRLH